MSAHARYSRILIKLSGELFGPNQWNIDSNEIDALIEQLRSIRELDTEIALVIGGGNVIRGNRSQHLGIKRVTADEMGMLGTVVNGLLVRDLLRASNIPVLLQSAVQVGTIVAAFVRDDTLRALRNKEVVIFVGGLGSPYFSTDTAASLRALEIGAEILLKATKVDGVYTDDPAVNPEARLMEQISYEEVLQRQLGFMDATAITLCMYNELPIAVFNMAVRGNMRRILTGEPVGTRIGG